MVANDSFGSFVVCQSDKIGIETGAPRIIGRREFAAL